jgi:hypothetical protein
VLISRDEIPCDLDYSDLNCHVETPDLKTMSGYPKMVQTQVTSWIGSAAEKMPEAEYAFRPDPAARSLGKILGHIADATISSVRPFWAKATRLRISRRRKPRRSS